MEITQVANISIVLSSAIFIGALILFIKLLGTILVIKEPFYCYEKDIIEYRGIDYFVNFIMAPFIMAIIVCWGYSSSLSISEKYILLGLISVSAFYILSRNYLAKKLKSNYSYAMLFFIVSFFILDILCYTYSNIYLFAYYVMISILILIKIAQQYAEITIEKKYLNITLIDKTKINNCELIKMFPDFIHIRKENNEEFLNKDIIAKIEIIKEKK